MIKIIIIGAGPIGCYTAQLLNEKDRDFDITIIEEHLEIGRPIHCAGLVSMDVLTQIKVPISDDVIINRIKNRRLYADNLRIKQVYFLLF